MHFFLTQFNAQSQNQFMTLKEMFITMLEVEEEKEEDRLIDSLKWVTSVKKKLNERIPIKSPHLMILMPMSISLVDAMITSN